MADGTTRQHPLSVAYLVYTDNPTRMCFVTMNPNRPKWKSVAAPTAEEAKLTTSGFYSYCASVELHAKEAYVLHHVDVDQVPNRVGITRKRWFTFQGTNRLSLRIDPAENEAPVAEETLLWERVGQ